MIRQIAASFFILGTLTPAQAKVVTLAPNVLLYCLDSTNTYQPILRANYGSLQQAFIRQFGWRHRLVTTSPSMGVLTFAPDREIKSKEKIYYDVAVYGGGIALLHMHARLKGVAEDKSGTDMCGHTWGILFTQ